jgi:hypothetical protein
MYREGLTIHLQECLGQFTSLSYNELVSATIDQERLMKAITEVNEKKRKRNNGSSSSSSYNNSNNSSTMLLLHCCSSLQSGHHSRFPPATFRATTMQRWDTSLSSTSCPSKATHHELRHPWSINKGAKRGVLHNGLAAPTTPPWMRSLQEQKC